MGFISRQIEKLYKNILFRRHDPDGSIFYFSHSDFEGLSSENFSFVSKRGHLLRGSFYHYGDPLPERLVIFEHGMANGHNAYFREIEQLAKHGFLVYSYDHTGCNKSEGEHIYGLSGSLSDLDDCINALAGERGFSESQITVIGHSWGGFSAMNILSRHPELRSIVAMSGFISIPVMQKQAVPLPRPFISGIYDLERSTNPAYAESSAIDVLRATERPVLLIHSTDDATVSYKWNFIPLSAALKDKKNVTLLTVSGSGHNPLYTKEAFAYKEAFFKDLKNKRRQGRLKNPEQRSALAASYDWHKMTEQNEKVWNIIFYFLDN